MTAKERTDLRIANTIREQLLPLRHRMQAGWPDGTGYMVDRMSALPAIHRKVERAYARRLVNAGRRLKVCWNEGLQDLAGTIQAVAQHAEQVPPDVRPLADLLANVGQIRKDFGGYEYFGDEPMLAVTTPPIALQGVDLGRFRIELNILSLGRRTHKNVFAIRTLDRKGAATNCIVRHPHVLGEHLNAREFTDPIRQAKLAGRIAEFFRLIVRALQTYDASTAYVRLDDWHKILCHRCHAELPEGLQTICEDCQGLCHFCGQLFCSHCLTSCATCGTSACQKCLNRGLCPACVKECPRVPDRTEPIRKEDMPMSDTTKNQPLPPDLAQRRQQLADALGFLLAQAWLREQRPAGPAPQSSVDSDGQHDELPRRPP